MKDDLIKQANKLQKELDILKQQINNENNKDYLFSITTYDEVCEALKEDKQTCPYKKIKQIEKLFNGNWVKNWDDLWYKTQSMSDTWYNMLNPLYMIIKYWEEIKAVVGNLWIGVKSQFSAMWDSVVIGINNIKYSDINCILFCFM